MFILCTPFADGRYFFGGASSGVVYVWETSRGRLLASFPAHYKAVTSMACSDDGSLLVTGGEDSLAHAWEVMAIVDASRPAHEPPRSLHSWSEHSLPITGVVVGSGGAAATVLTCSMDRRVCVWSLALGTLLKQFTLPAQALCVAMDPSEVLAFAGAADGLLYELPLVSIPSDRIRAARGGASAAVSDTAAAAPGAEVQYAVLDSQRQGITCLAATSDGLSLVAGLGDGTVRVYDVESRQCVRTLRTPTMDPVSAVFVIPRPPFLQSGTGLVNQGAAGATGLGGATFAGHPAVVLSRKGPKRPQPMAVLSK